MKNTIFVQIASYRDPELLPTLRDLIKNSKYPQNLKICIAWQHDINDEWDNLDEFKNDKRFEIIDIKHNESEGCCWARNYIQQKYSGEKYTLQLDSHHRFVKNWDEKLIKMYNNLKNKGHNKPLITGYIPSYEPKNDPKGRASKAWGMQFDRFTPEGVVFFLPYWFDNKLKDPLPARFYSAHFTFTSGDFCKEVPHDPDMYFHGEEISIAVRAFTHGYDLFHSNELIAWHEYTREGRTKHWDDHKNWTEINKASHLRMRQLLGVDGEHCAPCVKNAFGVFGLGNKRTLEEYQEYAGINFKTRGVRKSTLDNDIPTLGKKNESFTKKFKHIIDLNSNDFKYDDYTFAAVILEDKNGKSLYRKDEDSFMDKMSDKAAFHIDVEANISKPYKWVVWAYSQKNEWAEKLERVL